MFNSVLCFLENLFHFGVPAESLTDFLSLCGWLKHLELTLKVWGDWGDVQWNVKVRNLTQIYQL